MEAEQTSVTGWVEKIQTFKSHAFIHLRYGVGSLYHVQVVVTGTLPAELVQETYVTIKGTKKQLPQKAHSYQPYEIHIAVSAIVIHSRSDPDFAARCPSDASDEVHLQERHLYLRDPKFAVITKLRALLLKALRTHFESTQCLEIVPPCFVGNQCEGGATLFKLKHPGRTGAEPQDCYLTQSSQFYLEYALPGVGDCYCIYPSFRAEKSHTRRHLTEFLHAEAEWSGIFKFADHLQKLEALLYGTLSRFYSYVQAEKLEQYFNLKTRLPQLLVMAKDIKVMTHKEAIQYCRDHMIYKDPERQVHFDPLDDIPEAAERQMIDDIGKIVFLTHFPTHTKSFYMKPDEQDPTYALGCDVEVPGVGEIIGSGVRVSDLAQLKKRLKDEGLKEEDYREYLELRKYGHGCTSGMGLGMDRMLTWILATHTIRDVVTYPRYPGHLTP